MITTIAAIDFLAKWPSVNWPPATGAPPQVLGGSHRVGALVQGLVLPGGDPVLTLAASSPDVDYWPMIFVLLLATFVGLGVIARVSRLLHTPLMSLTNAISAIAVVGSIMVTGGDNPLGIRLVGAVAVAASAINIVSGFLITDRMLRFFKQPPKPGAAGAGPAKAGHEASSTGRADR